LQSTKEDLDKCTILELMGTLPSALVDTMKEALSNLDIDHMKTLFREVNRHSPNLADSLQKLVDNYEIDMLSDILNARST